MSNGTAEEEFPADERSDHVLSEIDALGILNRRLARALPAEEKALKELQAREQNRPLVKISVKTAADPALVEIDGILVGSSPLEAFEMYKGDHVLSIGNRAIRASPKRILMDKTCKIGSPLLRVTLGGRDKESSEKMKINVVVGNRRSSLRVELA